MAGNNPELVLTADTTRLDRGLASSGKNVEKFADSSSGHVQRLGKVIADLNHQAGDMNRLFGLIAEAWAGGQIISLMRSFVDAASQQQARVEALTTALDNMGTGAADSGKQMEEWAEKMAAASGYAVPQLIQGMTDLAEIGLTPSQIIRVTGIEADIAAAKHMNLARVQMLVARSISSGTVRSLARLGLSYKDINMETGKVGDGLEILGEKFRGQAAAHAKTYEGELARLSSTIDLVKESLGTGLLGVLGSVAEKMLYGYEVLRALSPAAKELILAVGGVIGVVTALTLTLPLAIRAVEILADSFGILKDAIIAAFIDNPIGWIVLLVAGVIAGAVAIITHWSQVKTFFANLWTNVKAGFASFVSFLGKVRDDIGQFVDGVILLFTGMHHGVAEVWHHVMVVVHDAIKFIGDLFDALGKVVARDHWRPMVDNTKKAWQTIDDIVDRGVDYAIRKMQGLAGAMASWGQKLFNALPGNMKQGLSQMGGAIAKFHQQVGDALINAAKHQNGGLAVTTDLMHNDYSKGVGSGMTAVVNWLKSVGQVGKIEVPTVPGGGALGDLDAFDRPQKGKGAKDTSGKSESNLIANLKQRLEDELQPYLQRVEDAKDRIASIQDQRDAVNANIAPNGVATKQQSAQLDSLDAQQRKAEIALSQSYVAQKKKEAQALVELAAARAKIAGNSKMQGQYRELSRAIDEAKGKIRDLTHESAQAAVAAANVAKDQRARHKEEAQAEKEAIAKVLEHQRALRELADANADLQRAETRGNVAIAKASRRNVTAVDNDEDKVADAQAALADAVAKRREAEATAAAARGTDEETQAATALVKAKVDETNATTELTVAQRILQRDTDDARNPVRSLSKAFLDGVPALKALLTSANPLGAAFAELVEKSRSWKDIQEILNNLFQVLANIFDSILLPVIKVLAQGLTFVANGFIALYNTIASLLTIFGIHIERLNYINSLLGNLDAGLITVTHDLPTLKQYQQGNWGQLSAAPGGPDGSTDPFQTSINQQTSAQVSWFSRIAGFLAVLVGIDWLTHGKFVSAMAGFFNQLGGKLDVGLGEVALGVGLLNTHSTGIIGVLEKIAGILLVVQGILTTIAAVNQAGGLGSILGALFPVLATAATGGAAAPLGIGFGFGSLASSDRRGVGSQSEASGPAGSLTDDVVTAFVDAINSNTAALQVATSGEKATSGVSGFPSSIELGDKSIGKLSDQIGDKVKASTTHVSANSGISMAQLMDALGRNQSIQTRTQRSAYTG